MLKAWLFLALFTLLLSAAAFYAYDARKAAPHARASAKAYVQDNENAINAYIANRLIAEHFALSAHNADSVRRLVEDNVNWRYHSYMPEITHSIMQAETQFQIPLDTTPDAPIIAGSLKIIIDIDKAKHQVISSKIIQPQFVAITANYGGRVNPSLIQLFQSDSNLAFNAN